MLRGPLAQYPANPALTHPRRSGDHLPPQVGGRRPGSRYWPPPTPGQSVRGDSLPAAPGTALIYLSLVHLPFVDQLPLYLEYVAGQARRSRESQYAGYEGNEMLSVYPPRPLLPAAVAHQVAQRSARPLSACPVSAQNAVCHGSNRVIVVLVVQWWLLMPEPSHRRGRSQGQQLPAEG